MATSQGLMGGKGLTSRSALDIQAFVDWTRDVDLPLKGPDSEHVKRGEALFNSPATGCADCHSGARHTDNKTYRMFGLDVQTRSLAGVAATAPYYHNGSVLTLRDVLDTANAVGMGNTEGLSQDQLDDLEAYLRSL